MLLAECLETRQTDSRANGLQAAKKRRFVIERERTDALRVRIKFLAYEAHVDLLELVSFMATVNLAALCTQGATSGLPSGSFDFLFRICPPVICTVILYALAGGEVWASLFDRKRARCWIQFGACLAFLGYAILVFCKSPWIPSPRDYVIFGFTAGLAHIRLRIEVRKLPRVRFAGLSRIAEMIRRVAQTEEL